MTPRQMSAFLFLANRRRETEMAELLGVVALGAQGTGEAIKKQQEKWNDGD